MIRALQVVAIATLALALAVPRSAAGQARPRPEWKKGHKLRVKIDSSPQQAAIYIDSKDYGIQGYTPSEFKLPKGSYRIILELAGWKTEEQILTVQKSQAFSFTLVKQARPAILDVRAATDQSSLGGTLSVDGAPVGSVPNQVEVSSGSHLIEVRKQGWNDYRDTVQVQDGERRTIVVALIAQQKPGSILVTADVAGADVYIDGVRRDSAPALIGDLSEGDHTVEVRKDPAPPWKQLVRVVGGQQTKVTAQLQAAQAATGSLKVLCSAPMADVVVDGDAKGPANSEIKDVRSGVHIVEVRAQGFESKRVEVEVKGGELRVIPIDLVQAVVHKQVASLHVISPVPDAEVFLDGSSVGKAPVDKEGLVPGKHFVVVHKEGYADYKVEIELEPGKTFQVSANLHASGSMRAMSNPGGAEVYIDGSPLGKTPVTLPDVGVGQHVVELKLKGYLDAKQTVTIAGGQQQIVAVDLTPENHGPTVGQLEARQREQSSFGAPTIDRFKFNVDLGVGYPYFLQARVITGVFSLGNIAGDIGIEFKTNGYENSVGLRPRVQLLRADPFALGVEMKIMGGGGPTKRNYITFELGALLTLIAGTYIHLTLEPYVSFNSDQLCPTVGDIKADDVLMGGTMAVHGSGQLYKNERPMCKSFDVGRAATAGYTLTGTPESAGGGKTPANLMGVETRGRLDSVRFNLRGVFEAAVAQRLTLWLLFEGAPFQPERQAFTGKFNDVFPNTDLTFYFAGGVTGKF